MSMRVVFGAGLLALLSLPARGQEAPASADLLKALRAGGHVIVFRHGATHADQADTDPLNVDRSLRFSRPTPLTM